MKFRGICIITENVARLEAFYKEILQVEGEGEDDFVRLLIDGGNIDIFSKQGMEEMSPGSTLNMGYGGYTIEIEVNDVDFEYERLKSKGISFIKLPITYPWGRRSAWFKDPDGNMINFYQILHRSIDLIEDPL